MFLEPFWGKDDDGKRHRFQWTSLHVTRTSKNPNGTSGFANVQSSETGMTGQQKRVHLCAHNPCRARWGPGKYGHVGPPMHVQACADPSDDVPLLQDAVGPMEPPPMADDTPIFQPPEAGIAAIAALPVPQGSVASVSSEAPELHPPGAISSALPGVASAGGPPTDVPPPPVMHHDSPLPPSPVAANLPQACEAPLQELLPADVLSGVVPPVVPDYRLEIEAATAALPQPPIPIAAKLSRQSVPPASAHVETGAKTPVDLTGAPDGFCQDEILHRILALSREVRGKGQYVGYAFFVLLGVLKKIRPFAWEGGIRIDLIQVFAPWACDYCQTYLPVDLVACCLLAHDDGHASMHHVCDEHPLKECKHWMGGHRPLCGGIHYMGPGPMVPGIQSFYRDLGIAVLGTTLDGNCGPDAGCMMLGLPRTLANRNLLRQDRISVSLIISFYDDFK